MFKSISSVRAAWGRTVVGPEDIDPTEWPASGTDLHFAVLMPAIPWPTWAEAMADVAAGRLNLTAVQRVTLAHDLAYAVAHLEAAGAAHRDLCARNLLVDVRSHQTALVDWDAMYHRTLAATKQSGGPSLGYAAPWASAPDAAWREGADRFALGLLIAEILTTASGDNPTPDGGRFWQEQLGMQCLTHGAVQSALGDWSAGLLEAYRMTWSATSFDDCPPASAWVDALALVGRDLGCSLSVWPGQGDAGSDPNVEHAVRALRGAITRGDHELADRALKWLRSARGLTRLDQGLVDGLVETHEARRQWVAVPPGAPDADVAAAFRALIKAGGMPSAQDLERGDAARGSLGFPEVPIRNAYFAEPIPLVPIARRAPFVSPSVLPQLRAALERGDRIIVAQLVDAARLEPEGTEGLEWGRILEMQREAELIQELDEALGSNDDDRIADAWSAAVALCRTALTPWQDIEGANAARRVGRRARADAA